MGSNGRLCLSAICLPILGVVAVAKSGGLPALASRVHPKFAFIFTLLIYLSIGPCLAIPRTASTSFEMAVAPFAASTALRVIYSLIFFAVALFLALHPEKLSDRLGKILGPCLLVLYICNCNSLYNSLTGWIWHANRHLRKKPCRSGIFRRIPLLWIQLQHLISA